jgi:hypothetical protein
VSAREIPDSVWHSIIEAVSPVTAVAVGRTAFARRRWPHARDAFTKALAHGELAAAIGMADYLGYVDGDPRGAAEQLRDAIARAYASGSTSRDDLRSMRQRLAWWTGLSPDPRMESA